MQDEPANNPESDANKHTAQGTPAGQPEEETPSEDAEGPERLDLELLDIDGIKVGEGAREPDTPSRIRAYHGLEAGPTEVVSFASPRSKARLEEALGDGDDETDGSLVRLPSLRSVQIALFILINLIVLILGGYVIYRSFGSNRDEEESRLEAPDSAAPTRAAGLATRPVPRNRAHGLDGARHTVTGDITPLAASEGRRRDAPIAP